MEPEALPLQVALLTMEVAAQRMALERLTALFEAASNLIKPAELSDG